MRFVHLPTYRVVFTQTFPQASIVLFSRRLSSPSLMLLLCRVVCASDYRIAVDGSLLPSVAFYLFG